MAKEVAKKTAKKTVAATEVKTVEQLQEDLLTAQKELMDSRRSHAQGELVNPHILTTKRKDIARLHTRINEEQRKESE